MNNDCEPCRCSWKGPNPREQSEVQVRYCSRDVWEDHDRCIWHAEIDDGADKPVEELLEQLQTQQGEGNRCCELLDEAQLSGLLTNIRF